MTKSPPPRRRSSSRRPKKEPAAPPGPVESADPGPEIQGPLHDVEVVFATSGSELEAARGLIGEYIASLPDDEPRGGADDEVRTLPGKYRAPGGALLIARVAGAAVGCVALRPAPGGGGEVKRMYVRSGQRGRGIGKVLLETILEVARARGYAYVVLDTRPEMTAAQRLYERLVFEETMPYYESPAAGTRYYRLEL